MRVKLVRIESVHTNLRTSEVIGDADSLPCVGERFIMWGEPLEKKEGIRYVVTSPVLRILEEEKDIVEFATLNSTYRLNLIKSDGGTNEKT